MRMRLSVLLFCSLVFNACQSRDYKKTPGLLIDDIAIALRKDLLKQYENSEKTTLAVAGFSRNDLVAARFKYKLVTPKLGLLIANALQTEMFNPARFDLIERSQIDALLSELDFHRLGITESDGIPSLRIQGIKAIILGSVQLKDGVFQFDARIVAVETGKVLAAATKVVDYYDFLNDAYNEYPKREDCRATIRADDSWQSTGCVIRNVAKLHVKATGSWSMTNDKFTFGPEGVSSSPSIFGDYRILTAANHGALICRIGERNMIYGVSNPWDVKGIAGALECRINDKEVYNNRGSITMDIELEE
ncbi:MAG: hypothetical protein JSR44_11465 [Spirochaetes bacterium]|nr:hypothetical protein [Spirochaetota bacterium]